MISSEAADWIPRGAFGSLVQYCRHVVAARRVAQMIEASDGLSVEDYDRLLKMQERESRALSSLATRLRLTPQSRYTPGRAATKGSTGGQKRKPWESE